MNGHRRMSPLACVVAAGTVMLGCGAGRHEATTNASRPSAGKIITAQEIEESGAANVWEALKLLAPELRATDRNGRPTRLQRRGPASIVLSDPPLVFLDGVRLADFRDLALVPARSVETIELLGLADGATYYGTNAAGGVIVIRTKHS